MKQSSSPINTSKDPDRQIRKINRSGRNPNKRISSSAEHLDRNANCVVCKEIKEGQKLHKSYREIINNLKQTIKSHQVEINQLQRKI